MAATICWRHLLATNKNIPNIIDYSDQSPYNKQQELSLT
ncbi:hypothetical protein SD78_3831 [Bacillus badius]|nr:hypothetical protein SD78_3831 [Bacillus badius]